MARSRGENVSHVPFDPCFPSELPSAYCRPLEKSCKAMLAPKSGPTSVVHTCHWCPTRGACFAYHDKHTKARRKTQWITQRALLLALVYQKLPGEHRSMHPPSPSPTTCCWPTSSYPENYFPVVLDGWNHPNWFPKFVPTRLGCVQSMTYHYLPVFNFS